MHQRTAILVIVFLLVTGGCGAPAAPSPTPTDHEVEPTTVASPTSLPSPVPTDTPTPAPSPTPTLRPVGWVVLEMAYSPVPRTGHAMAMLPDGRVLLFGGQDADGNALGDTWLFVPETSAQSLAPLGVVELALRGGPGWLAAGIIESLFSVLPAPERSPNAADWTPITPPRLSLRSSRA